MNVKQKTLSSADALVISANIRKLIHSRKISEAQLARALNVSPMTIRRVVSGETADPRISTLSQIADFFNVSVDSLIEKNDMPITFTQENKPHFIPILNWNLLEKFCSTPNLLNLCEWEDWYPVISAPSLHLDKKTFALRTKPSMQPRYPLGTLLIITPEDEYLDNDIVLVKITKSNDFSLRELIIDSPKWIFQPIITGSELIFYNEIEHDIIGAVVLTILHTRK